MADGQKPDFSAPPTIPFRFPRLPKDDEDLRLMVFTEVMRRAIPYDRQIRKRVRQALKALPKELPGALAAIARAEPGFQAKMIFEDVLQWVVICNEEMTGEMDLRVNWNPGG